VNQFEQQVGLNTEHKGRDSKDKQHKTFHVGEVIELLLHFGLRSVSRRTPSKPLLDVFGLFLEWPTFDATSMIE
jgi:hypothetical protein